MNRVVDWVANGDPYDSLADFPLRVAATTPERCNAPPHPSRGSWPRSHRDPPARNNGRPEGAMIHCRPVLHSLVLLLAIALVGSAASAQQGGNSLVIHEGRTPRGVRYAFLPQPLRGQGGVVVLLVGWLCAGPTGTGTPRAPRCRLASGRHGAPAGGSVPGRNSGMIRSGSSSEPAIAPPAASVGPAREAQPRSRAPPRGARHAGPVGAGSGPSDAAVMHQVSSKPERRPGPSRGRC